MIFNSRKAYPLWEQWIKSKDPDTLNEIMELIYPLAVAIVTDYFRGSNRDDVVQLCMMHVFQQLHKFDPHRGKFHTWLSTVIRNRTITHLRTLRKRLHVVALDEYIETDIETPHESLPLLIIVPLSDHLAEQYPTLSIDWYRFVTKWCIHQTQKTSKVSFCQEWSYSRSQLDTIYDACIQYLKNRYLNREQID